MYCIHISQSHYNSVFDILQVEQDLDVFRIHRWRFVTEVCNNYTCRRVLLGGTFGIEHDRHSRRVRSLEMNSAVVHSFRTIGFTNKCVICCIFLFAYSLIRPAENPFYNFSGLRRVLNYAFILCVHIGKLFCIDPIGFSHEYGFNCVREIGEGVAGGQFFDYRLYVAAVVGSSIVYVLALTWKCGGAEKTMDLLTAYSWMATLFPICGILKVGTFIADRIVVASTVAFALWGGYFTTEWIVMSHSRKETVKRVFFVATLLFLMAKRVMYRSHHWMTSFDLLQSSLKTCPNSAKSNLEMSKCYSGLFPEKLDYVQAR
jgi:hypothetical protein